GGVVSPDSFPTRRSSDLLPHLGGWEWAAAWITKVRGWELAAVVEALEPPELFEWSLEFRRSLGMNIIPLGPDAAAEVAAAAAAKDRKSTRLNPSHVKIAY